MKVSRMSKTALQPQFDTSFESRLAKIDLSAVMARVQHETALSDADKARAEMLYRQFLTLKARYPHLYMVPPQLADEVWHTHIMFTRQYFADCESLFGEYLHHTPTDDSVTSEQNYTTVTVPAYLAEFGADIRSPVANFGTCG
jgi:hypothetical protein